MYSMERYMQSVRTWQDTWLALGKGLVSAQQDIGYRTLDAVIGKMQPEAVMRSLLEPPASFARSLERSSRAVETRGRTDRGRDRDRG